MADRLQSERFALPAPLELVLRRGFRQAFLLIPVDPVRVAALAGALERLLAGDPAAFRGYLSYYPDGAAFLSEPLTMNAAELQDWLNARD